MNLKFIVVLSPLLLALAIWIKKENGGPVFYRGVRVGLHGKPFRVFKFRTMVTDAESIGGSRPPMMIQESQESVSLSGDTNLMSFHNS